MADGPDVPKSTPGLGEPTTTVGTVMFDKRTRDHGRDSGRAPTQLAQRRPRGDGPNAGLVPAEEGAL